MSCMKPHPLKEGRGEDACFIQNGTDWVVTGEWTSKRQFGRFELRSLPPLLLLLLVVDCILTTSVPPFVLSIFLCSRTGIADGVGGWSLEGIDAGEFARELMDRAAVAAAEPRLRMQPAQLLNRAHSEIKQETRGSCTACIVVFEGNKLR